MSAEDLEKWRGRNKPGMPIFPGPSDIRDAFILAKGIDWTATYIDPATWLHASRALVCRTRFAQKAINDQASGLCEKHHLRVMPPPSQTRIAAE